MAVRRAALVRPAVYHIDAGGTDKRIQPPAFPGILHLGKFHADRTAGPAQNLAECRSVCSARPHETIRSPQPPGGPAQGQRGSGAIRALSKSRPERAAAEYPHLQRTPAERIWEHVRRARRELPPYG